MGVYYKLLNITKKQQYEPANGAVKHGNFIWYAEEMVYLLLHDWLNDDVRMISDARDLYFTSEGDENGVGAWPKANPMYSSPDGDKSVFSLDHNGMTKLLTQFINAYGAEAVRVACDAAMEKAE